ncbi:hypothetical protein ACTVZO_41055 [Streptomyces sp. IBSNAI002]|uniref:hypothetical protein n=1 Tax=Streptomyces sp. IBSNAI002 TaxID=3457500 RepID=UPI003FD6A45F
MITRFTVARTAANASPVIDDLRTALIGPGGPDSYGTGGLLATGVNALWAKRLVVPDGKYPAPEGEFLPGFGEESGKGDRPTMATAQQPTSAQHRRVQWKLIDRALARYSTESLLVLLHAALASPGCSRFHDHLLLLWTRVLRTRPRTGAEAGAGELPGLVEAAVRAAPGRGTVTAAEPNDPRTLVTAEVAGERLLVHPGQLDHPLPFLRGAQMTALAVDEALLAVRGFTLTDVLELALRYTDRVVTVLAPAWPQEYEDQEPGEFTCGISTDEAEAARLLADLDPAVLVGLCRDPERAARALDWLTADLADLPLRYHPAAPLLGPVLAVVAHGRRWLVPVSAALDTFAAALRELIAEVPDRVAVEQRLQELAVERIANLLGLREAPVRPGPVCVISSPTHRYDIAIVSALSESLSGRVEEGRAALAAGDPGRGRLVVYAGPAVLGPELIRDTAYLHVEELAEILAGAEGDPALLALFVLELTEHPGVDAVFYREPLDAWASWLGEGTMLLPGPDREEVAVVPPAGFDLTWRRAAAWARLDDVLAAAGLPTAIHWRFAHLAEPAPGVAGAYADLSEAGDGGGAGGGLVVRVSTLPPLVVVASPSAERGAVLDLGAMTGLADSIRSTITGCPPVAAHFTLPEGAPVVVVLTERTQPHRAPAEHHDRDDEDQEPEERLLAHAGADPGRARIGIDLDPPLLESFTGDGSAGHRVLGLLLHHLTDQIRHGRAAEPGCAQAAFTEAWDAAHPVLRLTGATTYWPATAPHYTLPRSPHLHARSLRTAAAAVRRAGVPSGTWHGPDAYSSGGPGERLLHALEGELDRKIRDHQPGLVEELARHLNAAWSSRTRGRHEVTVNLTAPWGANWATEAGDRQIEAATATSALQLLLQQAIICPPVGCRPVDTLAVAELVALAELVLHCGTTAVAAARRLHDLHLEIHPTGVFTITSTDDETADAPGGELLHLGFDADTYHHARHENFIAQVSSADPEHFAPATGLETGGVRTPVAFTAPALPAGSQIARADGLLHQHQHWGFGLAALSSVLATAADWPTGPDGIAAVTAEDLVREAAAWSRLPEPDLAAAVDRLRLHPGNAAPAGPHAYTEVERRTRPATHPLIDQGGQLLVLPWLVHAAQEVYAAYLDEGRLPHPDLPNPVGEALRRHRQHLDERLEADLKTIACDAGLPHHFRLLEKTAAQFGIPGLTGEIDLLIADPASQRLWVIEAKNPEGAVAPHNLVQHIRKFTERYRDKLLAKAATITTHAAAASRACQAPDGLEWTVVPLIVTRSIEPAAFISDPRVAFTIADHLAHTLAAGQPPRPGWNSPARQTV